MVFLVRQRISIEASVPAMKKTITGEYYKQMGLNKSTIKWILGTSFTAVVVREVTETYFES